MIELHPVNPILGCYQSPGREKDVQMFEESNIREVLRKYTNQQKDLNSDYGK